MKFFVVPFRLSDYEAKLLLPALVEKSGHNQDKIRQENREVLRKTGAVYGPAKLLVFIKVCGATLCQPIDK